MKKNNFYILFSIFFIIILLFSIIPNSYSADPKIVTKLTSAFTKIKSWILKLSTPAAAVAVGTGIFIKKFSFGDDEKIRTGKKLIRTALISYVFIILLRLILTTISNLLSS